MRLRPFLVYPKDGEPFGLEFNGFGVSNSRIVLHIRPDEVATDRFLSFANVAAIVPVHQRRSDGRFGVMMKNGKNFQISADSFEVSDSAIKFTSNRYGTIEELKDVYLAIEEVIAITPVQYDGW